MVSVAFQGLLLKYNSVLEGRASSYKGCDVVANTIYSITFFFCFSLNPPMFQSPLGAVGARTGCAFPSVIGSHLDWVLDAELMRKLRGRRRRFPAAPPWTLCCWGSRAALAPLFLLFLLVTPVHPFCCIQSFPLTPRRSIAPSSQH